MKIKGTQDNIRDDFVTIEYNLIAKEMSLWCNYYYHGTISLPETRPETRWYPFLACNLCICLIDSVAAMKIVFYIHRTVLKT